MHCPVWLWPIGESPAACHPTRQRYRRKAEALELSLKTPRADSPPDHGCLAVNGLTDTLATSAARAYSARSRCCRPVARVERPPPAGTPAAAFHLPVVGADPAGPAMSAGKVRSISIRNAHTEGVGYRHNGPKPARLNARAICFLCQPKLRFLAGSGIRRAACRNGIKPSRPPTSVGQSHPTPSAAVARGPAPWGQPGRHRPPWQAERANKEKPDPVSPFLQAAARMPASWPLGKTRAKGSGQCYNPSCCSEKSPTLGRCYLIERKGLWANSRESRSLGRTLIISTVRTVKPTFLAGVWRSAGGRSNAPDA